MTRSELAKQNYETVRYNMDVAYWEDHEVGASGFPLIDPAKTIKMFITTKEANDLADLLSKAGVCNVELGCNDEGFKGWTLEHIAANLDGSFDEEER